MERPLDLVVDGERKKGRPKRRRTWKEQVEEESVKVVLRSEDVFR